MGLPLPPLAALARTVAAVSGLAFAVFPRQMTLSLALSGNGAAAELDFMAVAAAAPARTDVTITDVFCGGGFGAYRLNDALATLPQ